MLQNAYHEIEVISSEKAHFHLSGAVNNNIKVHVWKQPPGTPSINDTRKSQSNNVVCCFKFWSLFLRLLFLRKWRVRPCTVISHRYCAMLCDFLPPNLGNYLVTMRKAWFQERKLTAQTARQPGSLMFPGTSLRGDTRRLPRLPDDTIWFFGYTCHLVAYFRYGSSREKSGSLHFHKQDPKSIEWKYYRRYQC